MNPQQSNNKQTTHSVAQSINSEPYASMNSPTRKEVYYVWNQEKNPLLSYISERNITAMLQCSRDHFIYKLKSVRNGLDYDDTTKDRFIHDDESEELIGLLKEAQSNKECMTLKEARVIVLQVVDRRRIDVDLDKMIIESGMRRWLSNNGFTMSRPLKMNDVKSMIDRRTAIQFFSNVQLLRDLEHYPLNLMFNMDEWWILTEKKQMSGKEIHTPDIEFICQQSPDTGHITLIGCIAASDHYVKQSYIIPSPLRDTTKMKEYLLDDLHLIVNPSGYMRGMIFNKWINEILVPYVNEKRSTPDQHTLLSCDVHLSSINEEILQTLKHNNIDMIVLPAYSTSKYQPLDVGIYSSYKDNFRRYYRGKGGLYNLLFASINAFQCSFIPTKIQGAWEASHILDENINEYLNTLKD